MFLPRLNCGQQGRILKSIAQPIPYAHGDAMESILPGRNNKRLRLSKRMQSYKGQVYSLVKTVARQCYRAKHFGKMAGENCRGLTTGTMIPSCQHPVTVLKAIINPSVARPFLHEPDLRRCQRGPYSAQEA